MIQAVKEVLKYGMLPVGVKCDVGWHPYRFKLWDTNPMKTRHGGNLATEARTVLVRNNKFSLVGSIGNKKYVCLKLDGVDYAAYRGQRQTLEKNRGKSEVLVITLKDNCTGG